MAIIYKIQNKINGKVYIGQSRYSLEVRLTNSWCGHFVKAFEQNVQNRLYIALRKYGKDGFTYEILEERADSEFSSNIERHNWQNEREIFWVDFYKSYLPENGYNMTKGGNTYLPMSKKTKLKIANNKERNKKLSIAKIEQWKSMTNVEYKEFCNKISINTKKAMRLPSVRQKFLINNAEAAKRRIGEKHSEEWNEHIANGTKSAMWRDDIRSKQIEGRNKPEVRAKQSKSIKLTLLAKKLHKELDEQLAIAIAKEI